MSRFDKLCALATIPAGLFFLFIGIMALFAGGSVSFSIDPLWAIFPLLLGWSMSITLFRFWRYSKRMAAKAEDEESQSPAMPKQRRRPKISGRLFARFVKEYPEFKTAPEEVQLNAFNSWLERARLEEATTATQ